MKEKIQRRNNKENPPKRQWKMIPYGRGFDLRKVDGGRSQDRRRSRGYGYRIARPGGDQVSLC